MLPKEIPAEYARVKVGREEGYVHEEFASLAPDEHACGTASGTGRRESIRSADGRHEWRRYRGIGDYARHGGTCPYSADDCITLREYTTRPDRDPHVTARQVLTAYPLIPLSDDATSKDTFTRLLAVHDRLEEAGIQHPRPVALLPAGDLFEAFYTHPRGPPLEATPPADPDRNDLAFASSTYRLLVHPMALADTLNRLLLHGLLTSRVGMLHLHVPLVGEDRRDYYGTSACAKYRVTLYAPLEHGFIVGNPGSVRLLAGSADQSTPASEEMLVSALSGDYSLHSFAGDCLRKCDPEPTLLLGQTDRRLFLDAIQLPERVRSAAMQSAECRLAHLHTLFPRRFRQTDRD